MPREDAHTVSPASESVRRIFPHCSSYDGWGITGNKIQDLTLEKAVLITVEISLVTYVNKNLQGLAIKSCTS